jgi:hydrogenase maturation protease
LIIDLPPGTADAPLTVMQSFPISGAIVVFTPQSLVEMIVKKAINMARTLKKPLLGLVENMSYLYVPEIDKKIEVFGKSRGDELARSAEAPLIARIPLDPELVKLCDRGEIERYSNELVSSLGESLIQIIPVKAEKEPK